MKQWHVLHVLKALLLLSFSLLLSSIPAAAVEVLHFELESAAGPGWQTGNISVDLAWHSPTAANLQISAVHLQLPPPLESVTGFSLHCPNAIINNNAARCAAGELQLTSRLLDHDRVNAGFDYDPANGTLEFSLSNARAAGGRLSIKGKLDKAGWRFDVRAQDADPGKIPAELTTVSGWIKAYKPTGKLTLAAQITGQEKKVAELKLDGSIKSLTFSDAGGHRASDKLGADFSLSAQRAGEDWQFQGRVAANQGQLYIEPIFLEFPREAVKLTTRGSWQKGRLAIAHLTIDHPQVAQAQLAMQWRLNPVALEDADLKISNAVMAPFYKNYLQPLLIGTAFDALDSEGRLDMQLAYKNETLTSLLADFRQVRLEDQRARFGLQGLNGTLAWTAESEPQHAVLNWEKGHIYKLAFGAAQLPMQSANAGLQLTKGVGLPLLDGNLRIESLSITQPATPAMSLQLSGGLTPVSMEAFSAALDWPTMTGKLSGVIPSLSYTNSKIDIGGAMLMQAFDGDIVVRNLQLERPFGVVPLLSADVDLDNIDLDTLTRTFAFGRIQGKLGGTITGLRMENWAPVEFTAQFATPSNDNSRHRISQKAVNSLSSLGGVSGALSRSLLRFFDEFSYSRLGLTCRLQAGICEMGGVEPAGNGYYIVKGGGIPRIDVLGYATKVDWDVLVERLKNATRSEGPVVQ